MVRSSEQAVLVEWLQMMQGHAATNLPGLISQVLFLKLCKGYLQIFFFFLVQWPDVVMSSVGDIVGQSTIIIEVAVFGRGEGKGFQGHHED